jgi:hypothetical protein
MPTITIPTLLINKDQIKNLIISELKNISAENNSNIPCIVTLQHYCNTCSYCGRINDQYFMEQQNGSFIHAFCVEYKELLRHSIDVPGHVNIQKGIYKNISGKKIEK